MMSIRLFLPYMWNFVRPNLVRIGLFAPELRIRYFVWIIGLLCWSYSMYYWLFGVVVVVVVGWMYWISLSNISLYLFLIFSYISYSNRFCGI